MNVKELSRLIGKQVTVQVSADFYVKCRILDMRVSFGRVDALVTPLSGRGTWWREYSPGWLEGEEEGDG